MNDKPNTTPPADDTETTTINAHLDALLGMDARKPGTAAKLPAVIRITETLEPAGGKDFPVLPPSYAGESKSDSARYDLNGIEYGEILREKTGKDGTKRIQRYIKSARHCTVDSPRSHANRTEIAFRDDTDLRGLVPQAEAKIPRKKEFADQANANLLALPHRVADFRVRASDQKEIAEAAIKDFAKGDALKLLQLMPTSIIFGFWDSRAEGYQHKHARILLSRIDAFNVVPCQKHSLYTGPYSKDECAAVVLGNENLAEQLSRQESEARSNEDDEKDTATKEAKKWADKMAARGFSNALDSGLGGVFAESIQRLALISLTDIASIFCRKPETKTTEEIETKSDQGTAAKKTQSNNTPDKDLTNAARRYLLALALLAENYPRSTGSYRLRSGCELLPCNKSIDLRGAGAESESAKALIGLCANRELLIKVAQSAHRLLKIPASHELFESSPTSLKGDLEKGGKLKKTAAEDPAQARKAADEAHKKAGELALKADVSGTKGDRTKANNAAAKAKKLAEKADVLERKAAAQTEVSSEEQPTPAEPEPDEPDTTI